MTFARVVDFDHIISLSDIDGSSLTFSLTFINQDSTSAKIIFFGGGWFAHTHTHTTILQLWTELDFLVQNEDNTGRHTTIWKDCHRIQTNWCPHLCHPHHFYTGRPSLHNPPNLSWLGTGTKCAGLHTRWLGLVVGDLVCYNLLRCCSRLCLWNTVGMTYGCKCKIQIWCLLIEITIHGGKAMC